MSCALWLCFSSLSLSHSLNHTHTHAHTHTQGYILHVHTQANTFRALYPSHKQTQTHQELLFLPTNTLAQTFHTQWMSMVGSRHRPMKNACPFACFIRNTHRDSIPISAEKPHRNINYTGNLGGSVGRNGAEREYGIHDVILMRGSLSPAALGPTLLAQIIKYTLA